MPPPAPHRPDPRDLPDPIGTLDAFAAAWHVLSGLLAASPDENVIAHVRSLAEQWPLGRDQRDLRRATRLMARSAERKEGADAVLADMRALILGPGHLLAAPYSSVHLNRTGLVFEAETLRVRSFYHRAGLAHTREGREPDDHIAVELELLTLLASRALDAWDSGDNGDNAGEAGVPPGALRAVGLIADFLEQHALLWHPHFGELVTDQADTAFVQAVGAWLIGTSELAGEVFAAEIDHSRSARGVIHDRKADTSGAAGEWDAAWRKT